MIKANVIAIDKIDKMEWNDFAAKYGVIQQSYEWLNSEVGRFREILFFVVKDKLEILAGGSGINRKIFSNFLNNYTQVANLLFRSIEEERRKRHVISFEWNMFWSQWKEKVGPLFKNGGKNKIQKM